MQTPEQKVQNAIEKWLKWLQGENKPIFFEKRQAGGFTYHKGIPDMYVVVNGTHIEIEIKREGGEPTSMQLMWQRKLHAWGVQAYIVESVDEVKAIIEPLLA